MENKIICADVIDGLKQIPDGSVSLVCSSPPYNLSLPYLNNSDNLPYKDYLSWLEQVWLECKRTLRIGGRMAINMATITNRQEDKEQEYIRILPYYLTQQMKNIGMLPFAEIIWSKQDSAGRKTAFGSFMSCSCPVIRSNHEFIYVYSKDQYKLDGDVPSDITKDEFLLWTFSVWDIKPETRNLGNHPAPYPQELVKRIIKLYSYPNDLILDPFNGTGSTCVAAKRLKRRYIGIDNCQEYCDFAERRLRAENNLFDE
jgi:site-specific DNA-methyltransferase (adenine-specific)